MNRTRRGLLSTMAASSLSLTLAGCTSSESPPPGVAIEDISFTSWSTEDRTVQYQVERGDEVVVDASVTLEAEPQDDEGYYANEIVEHETLYERAVYTFRCRLASDDEWRLEFTFDGERYTCLKVGTTVSESGAMAVSSGEEAASRCEALTKTSE